MTDPIQTPTAADLPAVPATPAGGKGLDRTKIAELAHQFESMLMTQMLRSMRQSMLSDGESDADGFGKSTMTDTFDMELGQSLSKAGGIGLSDVLIRAFEKQANGRPGVPVTASTPVALPAAPAAPVAPAPATATAKPIAASSSAVLAPLTSIVPDTPETASPGADAAPVLPAGRVTSAYGWRNDPFNGQVKFHSGTDVKMAYGQDVKSAAAGRVAFVGQQSGYGLTVMVDHGNGVQSRYGHLSSATVQPGDTVESGQSIARSGNSGRSTGPHLHFEVLDNGRAVDPETMGQHLH
jgi:murein DD-endopeptidase MepM/ murein hydrolase activator NlpD